MKRRVEIRTNCRLHFGLSSLGHDRSSPQFGGIGVMVNAPGVHLEITATERFAATGPLSDRVTKFARLVASQLQLPGLPELSLRILSAPREHVGLGVGTQLGLAVAAGIAESYGLPWRGPVRLAQLTGRGKRSAIGTYGFLLGGLIVDGGHSPNEPLGLLKTRIEVPAEWRFVLVTPQNVAGRSGSDEERSMAELPPVPIAVTAEMNELIGSQIIPAVRGADFAKFSAALYQYGCLAGKCFAPQQGGVFSSKETAELIALLREQGVAGVGQSSWGPTVFALCENSSSASELISALSSHPFYGKYSIQSAEPVNSGAVIEAEGNLVPHP